MDPKQSLGKTAVVPRNVILLQQADMTMGKQKVAEARELYERLAGKAEKEGDKPILVQAMAMTVRCLLAQKQVEEAREWLARAEKEATPDERDGWSRYLAARGRLELAEGKKEEADATFSDMYDYCTEREIWGRAIDAAHMGGHLSDLQGRVAWHKKGIAAAEAGNQEGWLGPLWNNLGAAYWDLAAEAEGDEALGLNKDALECYLKARDFHWKVGQEINKLIADWAVGSAYRRAREADKAAAWLRPVLAWAQRRHALNPTAEEGEWVGWARYDLALLDEEQGNKDEALDGFREAKERLGEAKMMDWDKKTWDLLNEKIDALQ